MVPLGPADVPESRSFRTIGGIASPPLFKVWGRQISQNHRGPHASPDGLSAITCQVSRTQRNPDGRERGRGDIDADEEAVGGTRRCAVNGHGCSYMRGERLTGQGCDAGRRSSVLVIRGPRHIIRSRLSPARDGGGRSNGRGRRRKLRYVLTTVVEPTLPIYKLRYEALWLEKTALCHSGARSRVDRVDARGWTTGAMRA